MRMGQYELIRELGRGGMGSVYLARDTKLGRRVAIKFLHSEQPEITARFILEARATARCSHENIVVIYEVDEHEGHPFMVLEYLKGAPLGKQLKRGRSLPPGRVIELIVPVVRALAVAHKEGIVHRDLKPDNIYVTDSGTVKVLDFGVAKLLEDKLPRHNATMAPVAAGELNAMLDGPEPDTGSLTRRGALVGTLPYMSPEQWGSGNVDHQTDIWAVGILMFRMLTGRHPLADKKGWELAITGMLDEPMPSIRSVSQTITDEVAEIVDRCLIKPKDRRIGSADELLHMIEPLLTDRYTRRLRSDQSPYAGLSAFQEGDAGRFFGRTREVAAAVSRLRDRPLLGVIGPSGVGKSSFIRAGVVPALKQSGERWSSLVIRPGRQPVAALAHLVLPMLSESSSLSVEADLSELHAVQQRLYSEPGYLGSVLRSRARKRKQRLLIFVDQFEELYTLVSEPAERMAFTACLASVADDATTPLRVVLSIRSDFLDRVSEDEHFMAELSHGLFFLKPPRRDGLRDALVQPAEMAGYQFEKPAMVEHMLDHLEHVPGALPLLQFAAAKLWDTRDQEQKLLTEASYAQLGGIAGALASHADTVLAELRSQDQHLVRVIFLRLITAERTRAVVPISDLRELAPDSRDIQRVLDQLAQARLLVIQTGDGGAGATVEIVHESLIHSWPLLGRWLDANQDDAAFIEQLRAAAKQWQAKGYPAGLLWRGEAMEEARRFVQRHRGELPPLQRAYLNAVINFATRAERRKRQAVGGVIGFLSVLVLAAVVALFLIRNAQQQSEHQAAIARQAEEQVKTQLAITKQAMADLEEAKQKITAQRDEAEEANRKLEAANQQLQEMTEKLTAALEQARKSRRRALRAKKRALDKEAEARQAELRAIAAFDQKLIAIEELERALDRERKKVKKLELRLIEGGDVLLNK